MKIVPDNFPEKVKVKTVFFVLLGINLFLRCRLLFYRYFDSDELIHLHSSWSVFQGALPYKDFFEHHGPILYYLLAPLFYLCGNVNIIFISRGLMLLLTIGIIYLIFRMGGKIFNHLTACLASLWLSYNFMFLAKTLEVRPDVPAILFFLLGLIFLLDIQVRSRKRSYFISGIFFSLALLTTQKMVFLLGGIGILLVIGLVMKRYPVNRIIIMVLGFLLPIGLCLVFFASQKGMEEFLYRTIGMALRWKRRKSAFLYLKALAYHNPGFIFWSIWGFCGAILKLVKSRDLFQPYSVVVFPLLTAGIGLMIIPLPNPQYYALFIPLMSLLAAWSLLNFLGWLAGTHGFKRVLGGLLVVIPVPLFSYGLVYSKLFWFSRSLEGNWFWLILTILLTIGVCLLSYRKKMVTGGVIILLFLSIIPRPLISMWNYSFIDQPGIPRQPEQLRAIQLVLENTKSGDKVMDGWTGWSFLRDHAYYYHFLHTGILMMLSEEEKDEKILKVLKADPPEIIIKGGYLDWFSPRVRGYITRNYEPLPELRQILIHKVSVTPVAPGS